MIELNDNQTSLMKNLVVWHKRMLDLGTQQREASLALVKEMKESIVEMQNKIVILEAKQNDDFFTATKEMTSRIEEIIEDSANAVPVPMREHYSVEKMTELYDESEDGLISGVVSLELSTVLECDLESFLDFLSIELTGSDCLSDIEYKFVGTNSSKEELFFKVTGNPSLILDIEDEDEDESEDGVFDEIMQVREWETGIKPE